MKRRAFISGCTGQDGSYLAELLLEKDYEVFGLIRRSSTNNLWRIAHLLDRLTLIEGDLTDESSLKRALLQAKPHEIYNLASQSHVGTSFVEPFHTTEVTAMGALKLFETVRTFMSLSDHIRLYQASSSEMFGNTPLSPQTEETPMRPVSPYGCAKLFAHHAAHIYRQSYQMFIACGIAYNHESPRRGETFVTRKITRGLALVKSGQLEKVQLGNMLARRDWSFAGDIMEGAWLSLQTNTPDDWIFASGEQHSVQEFAELACREAGLEMATAITSNPTMFRPQDIGSLVGSSSKARKLLGWSPKKTFTDLVKEMVHADLAAVGCCHSVPSA